MPLTAHPMRRHTRPLLDWQGAADYLATTPRQVRRLRRRGELIGVRVGKFVRFHPDDLARFVDEHRTVTVRVTAV